jgi:hypothetical protein
VALTNVDLTHVRALLDGRPPELPSIDAADASVAPAAPRRYVAMGAHPWAGTSTVTLALAERASRGREHVVIVDAADRADSGLLTVAERDLPARDGCATGVRGAVQVRRPFPGKASPRPAAGPHDGLVFFDAGCQDEALTDPGDPSGVVLVCRATVPGLRSAEVALHRLGARGVVLAAVGARRLPNVVRGTAGLGVSELLATGRVVCFDHDRRLAVEGPDDRPLPRPLLASAGRVLDLLETDSVMDGGER